MLRRPQAGTPEERVHIQPEPTSRELDVVLPLQFIGWMSKPWPDQAAIRMYVAASGSYVVQIPGNLSNELNTWTVRRCHKADK